MKNISIELREPLEYKINVIEKVHRILESNLDTHIRWVTYFELYRRINFNFDRLIRDRFLNKKV